MRLQTLEKCDKGHEGLLRRLRVAVVVDANATPEALSRSRMLAKVLNFMFLLLIASLTN
jgi:hypothetical protein